MWTWKPHKYKAVDSQYDFEGYVCWVEGEEESSTFFPADQEDGERLAFWLNDRSVPKF